VFSYTTRGTGATVNTRNWIFRWNYN
jgi:hypothetical protein